ncbi:Hypothetical protein NTJ_06532 [Nesidiocoris tenuis]|uniref:Uncharacterized protein n=1 Tax=Nesidiocoris tenuis TaxID=355587 RepID=A0ABN7ANT2_9HEMI|nr:Hypothetical protein NTJ_06532 [Nesidiocoris tenuis]
MARNPVCKDDEESSPAVAKIGEILPLKIVPQSIDDPKVQFFVRRQKESEACGRRWLKRVRHIANSSTLAFLVNVYEHETRLREQGLRFHE